MDSLMVNHALSILWKPFKPVGKHLSFQWEAFRLKKINKIKTSKRENQSHEGCLNHLEKLPKVSAV